METLLENTVIQLLGIIIGGLLAIASAYMTLFVAKATQRAKIETEKLNDERQKAIVDATLDKVDELLKTNIIALENTVKKDMLELIADGKIEKDELMMWLKEHLSEKRYTHSIGTAECAQDLPKRFCLNDSRLNFFCVSTKSLGWIP